MLQSADQGTSVFLGLLPSRGLDSLPTWQSQCVEAQGLVLHSFNVIMFYSFKQVIRLALVQWEGKESIDPISLWEELKEPGHRIDQRH